MTTNEIETMARQSGVKIRTLLDRAGINRATWWRWAKGRFEPRAGSIERIKRELAAMKQENHRLQNEVAQYRVVASDLQERLTKSGK